MIVTGTDQEIRKRPVTSELEYRVSSNQFAVAPTHGWDMASDFSVLTTFTARSVAAFGLVGERSSDTGLANWWMEWTGTVFNFRADNAFSVVSFNPPNDFFQANHKLTWCVSVQDIGGSTLQIKFYFNGKEELSLDRAFVAPAISDPGFHIGRYGAGTSFSFDGTISAVHLVDATVSQSDISYYQATGRLPLSRAVDVARYYPGGHWTYRERASDNARILEDHTFVYESQFASGNGLPNHGVLTNFTDENIGPIAFASGRLQGDAMRDPYNNTKDIFFTLPINMVTNSKGDIPFDTVWNLGNGVNVDDDPFSFSCFFKRRASDIESTALFTNQDTIGQGYIIQIKWSTEAGSGNGGDLQFNLTTIAASIINYTWTLPLGLGELRPIKSLKNYFLCLTYTGQRTADDFRAYLYNIDEAVWVLFDTPPNSGDASHTEIDNNSGDDNLRIGGVSGSPNGSLKGDMYDVRWHTATLTSAQVEDTLKGIQAPSILNRWLLEDIILGSTMADSLGANSGTYLNSPIPNFLELGYPSTREEISDDVTDVSKERYGIVKDTSLGRAFDATNNFAPSNVDGYTVFNEFMTVGNDPTGNFQNIFIAGVSGATIAVQILGAPKRVQLSSTGNTLTLPVFNDFNRPHILVTVWASPSSIHYGSSSFGKLIAYMDGLEIGRLTLGTGIVDLSSLTNPTAVIYSNIDANSAGFVGLGGIVGFYTGEASPRTVANCSVTGRHRLPTRQEIEQDSMVAFSEPDFNAVNAFPIVVPDVSGNGNTFDGVGYTSLAQYQSEITDISNEYVNMTT